MSAAGLRVRLGSDIAMTVIFGLAFDPDLWGCDSAAFADMVCAVADRYCPVSGISIGGGGNSDGGMGDSGGRGGMGKYGGRMLRGQAPCESFLDIIRCRFGGRRLPDDYLYSKDDGKVNLSKDINEISNQSQGSSSGRHLSRLAHVLSRILRSLLEKSLSPGRGVLGGERDVASCVSALCDCPLGTVGAEVVLSAILGVLDGCGVIWTTAIERSAKTDKGSNRNNNNDNTPHSSLDELNGLTVAELIVDRLREATCLADELSSLPSQQAHKDHHHHHYTRTRKAECTEIASKLARSLLLAQFHDVVAPMLLGRTVFDGRRVMANSSPRGFGVATSRSSNCNRKINQSNNNHNNKNGTAVDKDEDSIPVRQDNAVVCKEGYSLESAWKRQWRMLLIIFTVRFHGL